MTSLYEAGKADRVMAVDKTDQKVLSCQSNVPVIFFGVFVHRVDEVILQADEVTD